MFAQLTGLLFDVLFDPLKDQEDLFPEEGFRQEQRQLLEMLDSEYNDKMVYAHQRCEELLFQGQNAGLGRCGSGRMWKPGAPRRNRGVGGASAERQNRDFCPGLTASRTWRRSAPGSPGLGKAQPTGLLAYQAPGEARRLTEEQPLSQSKLSMPTWRTTPQRSAPCSG